MMSRLEPLRFLEPGQGSGSEQTTGDVGHFPWRPTQPANDWCRFYRGERVWCADKQWMPITINYRQLVITKNNRLEFSDYSGHFFRPRCCKIEASREITPKKGLKKYQNVEVRLGQFAVCQKPIGHLQ
jgi:hypothetical protein